jgi:hypothetical protein
MRADTGVAVVAGAALLGVAGNWAFQLMPPGALIPAHCKVTKQTTPKHILEMLGSCEYIVNGAGQVKSVRALKHEMRVTFKQEMDKLSKDLGSLWNN